MAIADIYMVVFGSIAPVSLHVSASRHSDSTPDYRACRAVNAALQAATAVVGGHELASCGNGELYAAVERIPAANVTAVVQLRSTLMCALSSSRMFQVGSIVLASRCFFSSC